MKRHLLDRPRSGEPGPVCLDGSPAGFYYAAALAGSGHGYGARWIIHLEGGGWCYTPAQCRWRAKHAATGSSHSWPPELSKRFGPLAADGAESPFADWHRVYIKYCDGASFAGDTELSTGSNGRLHFRGRRILTAVVRQLQDKYGLGQSQGTEVLLLGCSAGGLAVILNVDYVKSLLPPTVTKFKAISGSGFFLDFTNVEGTTVFEQQMRAVFAMQNLSDTLSTRCQSRQGPGHEWRCFFATYAAPFVETPLFFLDSVVDAWQLGCVLTAMPIVNSSAEVDFMSRCYSIPSWHSCVKSYQHPLSEQCDSAQMIEIKHFSDKFRSDLLGSGALKESRNGAFITSCASHCGVSERDWSESRLKRATQIGDSVDAEGVLMRDAVWMWWMDDGPKQRPNPHVYLPCSSSSSAPFQCNASCPALGGATLVVSVGWHWFAAGAMVGATSLAIAYCCCRFGVRAVAAVSELAKASRSEGVFNRARWSQPTAAVYGCMEKDGEPLD